MAGSTCRCSIQRGSRAITVALPMCRVFISSACNGWPSEPRLFCRELETTRPRSPTISVLEWSDVGNRLSVLRYLASDLRNSDARIDNPGSLEHMSAHDEA